MAPFRVTPASKPGAGAFDHWKGSPVYGNTHGKLWFELDLEEDEYDPNWRYSELVAERKTDEEADAYDSFIGKTYKNDEVIIDTRTVLTFLIPTPYGVIELYSVYFEISKRMYQVYKYEFFDWKFLRLGKVTEQVA